MRAFRVNALQASIVKNIAMTMCHHDVDSRNGDVAYGYRCGHNGLPSTVMLYGHKGQESGLGQALRNLLPAIGAVELPEFGTAIDSNGSPFSVRLREDGRYSYEGLEGYASYELEELAE